MQHCAFIGALYKCKDTQCNADLYIDISRKQFSADSNPRCGQIEQEHRFVSRFVAEVCAICLGTDAVMQYEM